MKKKSNKKITMIVSLALAVIMIVGATFAWVTSRDEKINHFENKGYLATGIAIVEDFTPPTDWQIGATVKKEVAVMNTVGDNVFVRVSFEELLKVLGNNGLISSEEAPDMTANATGTIFPVEVKPGSYASWADTVGTITLNGAAFEKPANLKFVRKGNAVAAYYEFTPGSLQVVDIGKDITVTGNDINLKQALKYQYYTESVAATYFNWNGIDASGMKGNIKDTAWQAQIAALTSAGSKPAAGAITKSQLGGNKIELNFSPSLKTDMSANSWYYNANDGYFYWIGVVTSGSSTQDLLSSVKLPSNAGAQYAKISYDIGVVAEGIYADKEAINAATTVTGADNDGNWNLSGPLYNTLIGLLP